MIFVDCKSAYAGSIPTSASTLKSPAAIELAGLFYACGFCSARGLGQFWDSDTFCMSQG
jgi:hypothetical protein